MIRGRLALLVATVTLAVAPAAAPAATSVRAVAAKSCSGSYTHAVIGGTHKCLRVGQFCARRDNRQYHRYGFNCRKRDYRGSYHLTYRR
jgi:hypothetical protein